MERDINTHQDDFDLPQIDIDDDSDQKKKPENKKSISQLNRELAVAGKYDRLREEIVGMGIKVPKALEASKNVKKLMKEIDEISSKITKRADQMRVEELEASIFGRLGRAIGVIGGKDEAMESLKAQLETAKNALRSEIDNNQTKKVAEEPIKLKQTSIAKKLGEFGLGIVSAGATDIVKGMREDVERSKRERQETEQEIMAGREEKAEEKALIALKNALETEIKSKQYTQTGKEFADAIGKKVKQLTLEDLSQANLKIYLTLYGESELSQQVEAVKQQELTKENKAAIAVIKETKILVESKYGKILTELSPYIDYAYDQVINAVKNNRLSLDKTFMSESISKMQAWKKELQTLAAAMEKDKTLTSATKFQLQKEFKREIKKTVDGEEALQGILDEQKRRELAEQVAKNASINKVHQTPEYKAIIAVNEGEVINGRSEGLASSNVERIQSIIFDLKKKLDQLDDQIEPIAKIKDESVALELIRIRRSMTNKIENAIMQLQDRIARLMPSEQVQAPIKKTEVSSTPYRDSGEVMMNKMPERQENIDTAPGRYLEVMNMLARMLTLDLEKGPSVAVLSNDRTARLAIYAIKRFSSEQGRQAEALFNTAARYAGMLEEKYADFYRPQTTSIVAPEMRKSISPEEHKSIQDRMRGMDRVIEQETKPAPIIKKTEAKAKKEEVEELDSILLKEETIYSNQEKKEIEAKFSKKKSMDLWRLHLNNKERRDAVIKILNLQGQSKDEFGAKLSGLIKEHLKHPEPARVYDSTKTKLYELQQYIPELSILKIRRNEHNKADGSFKEVNSERPQLATGIWNVAYAAFEQLRLRAEKDKAAADQYEKLLNAMGAGRVYSAATEFTLQAVQSLKNKPTETSQRRMKIAYESAPEMKAGVDELFALVKGHTISEGETAVTAFLNKK